MDGTAERIMWTLTPPPSAPAPVMVDSAWYLRLDESWSNGGPVVVTPCQRWSDQPSTLQAAESFRVLSAYQAASQAGVPWSALRWTEPEGRVERWDVARDFVRRSSWDDSYGRKMLPVPRTKGGHRTSKWI